MIRQLHWVIDRYAKLLQRLSQDPCEPAETTVTGIYLSRLARLLICRGQNPTSIRFAGRTNAGLADLRFPQHVTGVFQSHRSLNSAAKRVPRFDVTTDNGGF